MRETVYPDLVVLHFEDGTDLRIMGAGWQRLDLSIHGGTGEPLQKELFPAVRTKREME